MKGKHDAPVSAMNLEHSEGGGRDGKRRGIGAGHPRARFQETFESNVRLTFSGRQGDGAVVCYKTKVIIRTSGHLC